MLEPELAKNEQEWRERYARRVMSESGCLEEFAIESAQVAEIDLSEFPEDAADAEMEYWTDDGC